MNFTHTHQEGLCQGLFDGCQSRPCQFEGWPVAGPVDQNCENCGFSANLHLVEVGEDVSVEFPPGVLFVINHNDMAHWDYVNQVRRPQVDPESEDEAEHWLWGPNPIETCDEFEAA
jgi:hypothetical protein